MALPLIGVVMAQTAAMPFKPEFEVHFRSLLRRGFELIFPCDGQGRVNLDALSDRAKVDYLFARAMVGREYAGPAICLNATPESGGR